MKLEANQVLNLLEKIEEFLNAARGVIKQDDFNQSNFEDKFMKELNNELVEAEVITIRDI